MRSNTATEIPQSFRCKTLRRGSQLVVARRAGLALTQPEKAGGGSDGAFTLIELIAVVAIVLILAAALLPALKGAVARADSAKSLGNMKNLGAAVMAFSGDNGGNLPNCFNWPDPFGMYEKPAWVQQGTIGKDWPSDMWIWALVNNQNLPLIAFTSPQGDKQLKAISEGPRPAFLINQVPTMLEQANNKNMFTNPTRFSRPANTILLFEAAFNEQSKGWLPWMYCNYWPDWGVQFGVWNERMGIKRNNYVFMDGHAENLRVRDTVGSAESGNLNTTRWLDPTMFPNAVWPTEEACAAALRAKLQ